MVELHLRNFDEQHQATPEQELFLAARTGNEEAVVTFIKNNSADFNAQDINGKTAKEMAMAHGHLKMAYLMPKAVSSALSKEAMVAETVRAGGKKWNALLKFHIQPVIVIVWCFLHYFDIYNDLSLTLKFGNIHLPPFNTQCGCNHILFNPSCDSNISMPMFEEYTRLGDEYTGACSTYRETGYFYLSAGFITLGVTAACLIDYFMMKSTEPFLFIFVH